MAKRFGAQGPAGSDAAGAVQRERFEFGVMTAEGVVVHEFWAVIGQLHAGGLIAALMAAEGNDGGKAAEAYYRTIAKMIDNRDGIPSDWKPKPLPRQEGDDRPEMFRVPWGADKGALRPMSEADAYLDSEVHSSRRRWLHLMEVDADAVVEFGDLSKLFEWMVAQSSGNRSAASS